MIPLIANQNQLEKIVGWETQTTAEPSGGSIITSTSQRKCVWEKHAEIYRLLKGKRYTILFLNTKTNHITYYYIKIQQWIQKHNTHTFTHTHMGLWLHLPFG